MTKITYQMESLLATSFHVGISSLMCLSCQLLTGYYPVKLGSREKVNCQAPLRFTHEPGSAQCPGAERTCGGLTHVPHIHAGTRFSSDVTVRNQGRRPVLLTWINLTAEAAATKKPTLRRSSGKVWFHASSAEGGDRGLRVTLWWWGGIEGG